VPKLTLIPTRDKNGHQEDLLPPIARRPGGNVHMAQAGAVSTRQVTEMGSVSQRWRNCGALTGCGQGANRSAACPSGRAARFSEMRFVALGLPRQPR